MTTADQTSPLKAITLTQPWAEAVALEIKKWETRSWTTTYRGTLLIHAAKGYPRYAQDFAATEYVLGRIPGRLAFGAIIAVCDLLDVRPAAEVALEVSTLEQLYGDYSPGRFAWQLANVRRLKEPIPAKGALSLWTPSPETLAAIEAAS